jgi:hypothetical protein
MSAMGDYLITWAESRGLDPADPRTAELANADLATRDASLGVGHIWTATHCRAYRTYAPSDCTCGAS